MSGGAAHPPPIRHLRRPQTAALPCHSDAPRGISSAPLPNHPPPLQPTHTVIPVPPHPSFLHRQEPRHTHTPPTPTTSRRTPNLPLPLPTYAVIPAEAEPAPEKSGEPIPPENSPVSSPSNSRWCGGPHPIHPKTHPSKLLTPLHIVLYLHRSNNKPTQQRRNQNTTGKPPETRPRRLNPPAHPKGPRAGPRLKPETPSPLQGPGSLPLFPGDGRSIDSIRG